MKSKSNCNNILYKTFTLIFVCSVTLTACKKFVEIPAPQNELITETVFSGEATANAAVTDIYSQMINDNQVPYFYSYYTGLLSDELTSYSLDQDPTAFYTNDLNSFSQGVNDLWSSPFRYLYRANAVIEGVQKSELINSSLKQQLLGEALFIRSFCNFYLVNLFGDIPLIKETDYSVTKGAARVQTDSVYDQIIADLLEAEQLLADNYVGADGISESSERVRPNKWVAKALLARVYLYRQDYTNAETKASELIDNSELFWLEPDLNSVFLANSNESIWQLQPSNLTGYNTPEGQNYILEGPPESGQFRSTTVSEQLLNAFEAGDLRQSTWIGSFDTYYFPNKYKIPWGTDVSEYSTVFRLAEQYLIRAEARAQLNNISQAQDDLNNIRTRAGLPATTAVDKESLLLAIAHERQVELFTEWGHRWLDIKRTGRANEIMSGVTTQKGGSWSSNDQLLPIPQTDRSNNPNLSQNLGY